MELIKEYIYKKVASRELSQEEAKKMLKELQARPKSMDEDIAIIGIAARMPEAKNTEEYWKNLIKGQSCITGLPENRKRLAMKTVAYQYLREQQENISYLPQWKKDFAYDLLKELAKDKADSIEALLDRECIGLADKGAFIDNVDQFDPQFFRIPPSEAVFMEPWQRILLETVWETVEDAGYGGKSFYNSRTGIFIGRDNVQPADRYKEIARQNQMLTTGTWPGILAGRISYIFNLTGPSMIIDTACSSGLVSVHMACKALKNGECDMAIAGGVSNINYVPEKRSSSQSALASVESGDAVVRTFDKNANGTVWGEGLGTLLLKPLSKALADKDNIYAVIKGTSINNDGASNGLTAPNAEAQEDVIIRAWKEAKVHPETIQYIEAHGTGTVLGDPIEVKALTNAFSRFTNKKQFCGIGSVKTNIGHLVGASGIASLLKVVLALKNGQIPASLNIKEPNPFINFSDSPLYINDSIKDWHKGEMPRRAGVSAFGFMGTNAHVVLEEAPKCEEAENISSSEIFTLSARSKKQLEEIIDRYEKYIEDNQGVSLRNLCYTANTGRGHYQCRLAVIAKSYEDFKHKIRYLAEKGVSNYEEKDIYYLEHKVVADNRKELENGWITESGKRKLSIEAETRILDINKQHNIEKELSVLAKIYIQGADVDWEKLYTAKCRKMSLPVYVFDHNSFWPDIKEFDYKRLLSKGKGIKKEISHPLLDKCIAESIYQDVFITTFEVEKHWVLNEHKVLGNYIIPGTTYLEIVRCACEKYYKNQPLEFNEVIFIAPFMVKPDERKELQTIILKKEDYMEFVIASKYIDEDSENEEKWIKHVEGKISPQNDYTFQQYEITDLISKCNDEEEKNKAVKISASSKKSIEFGDRWKNTKNAYFGENEVLIELELPDSVESDLGDFYIHPSLLDNAVNFGIQRRGDNMYLPLYYGSLKLKDKMPKRFYSHMRMREKALNDETISFDISLINEVGQAFAEIEDYKIKKVNNEEFKLNGITKEERIGYYNINWVPQELLSKNQEVSGRTLVFRDGSQLAGRVINELKNQGVEVIEIQWGRAYEKYGEGSFSIGQKEEDYEQLFSEFKEEELPNILHLFTISHDTISEPQELQESQEKGIYSLFNITKAILKNKVKGNVNILTVSSNANMITGQEEIINPHNASLFGFGKAVGLEYANIKCRALDIDQSCTEKDIIKELYSTEILYQSAIRESKRYIQEFESLDISKIQDENIEIKDQGVYLITGGMGGLGLETAKHLALKNKIRIALIGRSKVPEREKWSEILKAEENKKLCHMIRIIREIEAKGAEVRLYSADVSDYDEMKAALEDIRETCGSINGIIHCAGNAGDGFIINKSRDAFDKVLAPKIAGTWILDKLTEKENLDFFVMFSSMTSITSSPGQSDYTAANAYLDTFASFGKRNGMKYLALNWPAWKETGMAVDHGAIGDRALFKPITTIDALNILDQALNKSLSNVIVGELNYKYLIEYEEKLSLSLSQQLKGNMEKKRAKTETGVLHSKTLEKIAEVELMGKGEKGQYTETEITLAKIWGKVLGINRIDIFESFNSMGGDSIMATILQKSVNERFPGAIDLSDVFEYITVEQMAGYIDSRTNNNPKLSEIEKNVETEEAKEILINNLEIPEKHRIDNINPFNDVFFKSCFYNALFPVMNYYGKNIDMVLANDACMYAFKNRKNGMPLDIEYVSIKDESHLLRENGITSESKILCKDLQSSIIVSVANNRPIIVLVDAFYESIREDTYMNFHWYHALLIYGYNRIKGEFTILEHDDINSLNYREKYISFEDLNNAYKGCLENFRQNSKKPSYYELTISEDTMNYMQSVNKTDYSDVYIKNIFESNEILKDSAENIKKLIDYWGDKVIDENYVIQNMDAVLFGINNIVKAKNAEIFKVKRLYGTKSKELEDEIIPVLTGWMAIRAVFEKYKITSIFKKKSFEAITRKLEDIYNKEISYINKIQDSHL